MAGYEQKVDAMNDCEGALLEYVTPLMQPLLTALHEARPPFNASAAVSCMQPA